MMRAATSKSDTKAVTLMQKKALRSAKDLFYGKTAQEIIKDAARL